MKNDLISRQEAIDKLRSNIPYMQAFGCDRSITLIKELPSAQPERKRGQWIEEEDPYGIFAAVTVCSECGYVPPMKEKSKYCPNCGTRMEGEIK